MRTREPKLSKADIIDGFGCPSAALYVIVAGESAVKIGYSNNVWRRARALQSAQEKPVHIFWAVKVPLGDAKIVERAIHNRLKSTKSHASGEWYYMGPAFARKIIEDEIGRLNIRWKPDLSYGLERN